jgi:hypothetical protein
MACGTNIVPGFDDSNKIKDHGLEVKIEQEINAFHGSPERNIIKFSTDKIGTGEGAQVFGWGLYFTDSEGIASKYADQHLTRLSDSLAPQDFIDDYFKNTGFPVNAKTLDDAAKEFISRKRPDTSQGFRNKMDDAAALIREGYIPKQGGAVYSVTIKAGKSNLLLWHVPLNKQHPDIQNTIKNIIKRHRLSIKGEQYGSDLYQTLARVLGPKKTSKYLLSLGIRGIKYNADTISGNFSSSSKNYVVFDERHVAIQQP